VPRWQNAKIVHDNTTGSSSNGSSSSSRSDDEHKKVLVSMQQLSVGFGASLVLAHQVCVRFGWYVFSSFVYWFFCGDLNVCLVFGRIVFVLFCFVCLLLLSLLMVDLSLVGIYGEALSFCVDLASLVYLI